MIKIKDIKLNCNSTDFKAILSFNCEMDLEKIIEKSLIEENIESLIGKIIYSELKNYSEEAWKKKDCNNLGDISKDIEDIFVKNSPGTSSIGCDER